MKLGAIILFSTNGNLMVILEDLDIQRLIDSSCTVLSIFLLNSRNSNWCPWSRCLDEKNVLQRIIFSFIITSRDDVISHSAVLISIAHTMNTVDIDSSLDVVLQRRWHFVFKVEYPDLFIQTL